MKIGKKLAIIFTLLFFLTLNKEMIIAADVEEKVQETLAVALVIDNSSSMADTDPEKLREAAANIFMDLLSPEDYLTIITFNTETKVILPMEQVKDNENKSRIKETLRENIDESGYTDYRAALNAANEQLDSIKKGNMKKAIVFLTDGEPMPNWEAESSPQYMEEYMKEMWQEASNMGLKKYSIYPVGLSEGIDSNTLEKLAEFTQGQVSIVGDASELAVTFFDILGTLKNRRQILNDSIEVRGKYTMDVDLSSYTSQCTMVVTQDGQENFTMEVVPPKGLEENIIVELNDAHKYKIVTINQGEKNLQGNWKVNFQGQGNFRVFSNEDLVFKSWIKSPSTASLQPINEPLEIDVEVTGNYEEDLSVEASILKDGVAEGNPVKLILKDGAYKGIYDGVSEEGDYEIEVMLMLDGKVISTRRSTFRVRDLPAIISDSLQDRKNYRLGETIDFAASLKMLDGSLLKNTNLIVENYNLLLEYAESGTETFELYYDGMAEGAWRGKINFNEGESCKASLRVNGIYKGEKFLIEKTLGSFQVYPPGSILMKVMKDKISYASIEKIKIPIYVESTSKFDETLVITMDEGEGILSNNIIQVKPMEKSTKNIYVTLYEKKKDYPLTFQVRCENEDIALETSVLNTRIEFHSKVDKLKMIFNNKNIIIFIGAVILGLPLGIICLGFLFYKILVGNKTRIKGQLLYWRDEEFSFEAKSKLDFSKNKKKKIIISFNKENKKADYYIPNKVYKYDIEINSLAESSKWKFIDGYKALLNPSYRTPELLIKTLEPGILTYDGRVFTRRKLYKGDIFYSGEYVFQYVFDESKKVGELEKGRNLLSR